MNATETIFALALASNDHAQAHFSVCLQQLKQWGELDISPIYVIPCRDGIGADYWNAACLLRSDLSVDDIIESLRELEAASGRVRPSHQITLDIDLIAWGNSLSKMNFNVKKLPLAMDVKAPMYAVWPHPAFQYDPKLIYPKVSPELIA